MSALVSDRMLERLARLEIGTRRARGGRTGGDRSSGSAGSGTTFLEHRAWSPGDDLRYIDWNAWRRLGTLQTKVFELEESLDLHLFVDASASMGRGRGSKLETACRVAAMVGSAALARGDTVRVRTVPGADRAPAAVLTGRPATPRLVAMLSRPAAGAREPLSDTLRAVFPEVRRRAAALLVSDFLGRGPGDTLWRGSIDFLLHRRVELLAVHVVGAEERRPRVAGPLRLRDAESGDEVDVDVDEGVLAAYVARFERHVREVGAYLRSKGVPHVLVDTARSGEGDLLRTLLRSGVLR